MKRVLRSFFGVREEPKGPCSFSVSFLHGLRVASKQKAMSRLGYCLPIATKLPSNFQHSYKLH